MLTKPSLTCSFCGAEKAAGKKIVAGPMVGICESCVRNCAAIVGPARSDDMQTLAPPEEDELDSLVQRTQRVDDELGKLASRAVNELRALRAAKR